MNLDKVYCAVTHGLVHEIGNEMPNLFLDHKGNLKVYEILYYLGFDINWKMYNKNVSKHYDTLIRSNLDNEKCYKTLVYKGKIRKDIDKVVNGEIIYHKTKLHHLNDLYQEFGVLQPKHLENYVKEEDLLWIEDFGGKSTLEECL